MPKVGVFVHRKLSNRVFWSSGSQFMILDGLLFCAHKITKDASTMLYLWSMGLSKSV